MKNIVKRVMDKDPVFPPRHHLSVFHDRLRHQTAASMPRAGKANSKNYTPRHLMIDVDLITPDDAKGDYFIDSVY